jgi:predicted O-linked N-acetylglucosamine transferase (SPINDLY family)
MPGDPLAAALAHHRAGRLAEAERIYAGILARTPANADVLHLYGLTAYQSGRLDQAVARLTKAVTLRPGFAEALNNLGLALQDNGDFEAAIARYGQALAARPDYAIARVNQANALARLGDALRAQGKPAEAMARYQAALRLNPEPEILNNLGLAYRDLGRPDEAMACFERAAAQRPDLAEAHLNRGLVLADSGAFDAAEQCYRRALGLREDAGPLNALGHAMARTGRLDEAEAMFRRALALRPGFADALSNLGATLQRLGRLDEAIGCHSEAADAAPGHMGNWRNLLAAATYCDAVDDAAFRDLHLRFAAACRADPLPAAPRTPSQRLRIGYLSSDFRDHPLGLGLLPVLRRHDRAQFAVTAYSLTRIADAVTAEFRGVAEAWRDVAHHSDQALAEAIRADGIDILVVLAGRFDDNRPSVAARRPAPVQIAMHDVATSGLAEMDYLIADRWLVPRGTREFFTERVLRPPSFPLMELPAGLPDPADGPPPGPPVFGSFNNPSKITPSLLRLWGALLARNPQARLALAYFDAYQTPSVRRRILDGLGANPAQVAFLPPAETRRAHFERFNGIAAVLDTVPFSGSTTSFHALSMGVPVVTRRCARMAGRWTLSMLRTLRLDSWIAETDADYLRIAAELAGGGGDRRGLRARVARSALCDADRWTRNVERLYRAAWRRHASTIIPS